MRVPEVEAMFADEEGPKHPYGVENGHIVRYRDTKDGLVIDALCNFTATVKEEVILDDGAETSRAFVIGGKLETRGPA